MSLYFQQVVANCDDLIRLGSNRENGSMIYLVILIVIVVLLLVVVADKKGLFPATAGQGDELRYIARPDFFSAAERSFYGVLDQAVGEDYRIFGKVRLGDLVQPAKGMTKSQSTTARNRLNQKHVDFLLCRLDTLAVVAVIELDDASHARNDRSERDDFVDKVLAGAKIPVRHFPARKAYSLTDIQEALVSVIKPAAVASVRKQEQSSPPLPVEETQPQVSPTVSFVQSTDEPPNCPDCKVPMVKRQAKKGPNTGQWFWACTGYPKCRKVIAVGGS